MAQRGLLSVVPLAPLAAGAILWRQRGQLHTTVVVETRLRIVPDGVMRQMLPEPLDADPEAFAPRLEHADVVLTCGHAHAPAETGAAMAVRLALYRSSPLIDKSLLVYPAKPGAGSRKAPIEPPEPEQAALVDPTQPGKPARLGPYEATHAERQALLGGSPVPALRGRVLGLADGVRFGYFQVAPADQQTSFLQGDEWLVLDGMSAAYPRVQSQLPGLTAAAQAYPPGGSAVMLTLAADRLRVDADALTCTLSYRGSFPVADEKTALATRLAAIVVFPRESAAFPSVEELDAHEWHAPGADDDDESVDEPATLELTSDQGAVVRAALGLGSAPAGAGASRGGGTVPQAVARALEEALKKHQPTLTNQSVDKLEITLADSLQKRGGNMDEYVSSLFYRLEGDPDPQKQKK